MAIVDRSAVGQLLRFSEMHFKGRNKSVFLGWSDDREFAKPERRGSRCLTEMADQETSASAKRTR
ncbi:hypothetical protein ABTK42_19930, partial [Acinetobacter baumannii]